MNEIQAKPFILSHQNELLEFALLHPCKPSWSKDHIIDFIQHLTSRNELIFDLYAQERRIAAAILIDKISNKGNNACLEFIGIDNDFNITKIYKRVIALAKDRLPKNRTGIEITVHDSSNEVIHLVLEESFTLYYDIYEMRSLLNTFSTMDTFDEVSLLDEHDFPECYKVVIDGFKDNVDVSIPTYNDWILTNKTSHNAQTWVYKEKGKIVGLIKFAIDSLNQSGEIRSVCVLPNLRCKGLGRKLISFALSHLKEMNIHTCHLTVASVNRKALFLYEKFGFRLTDHYKVYCWKS